MNPANRPRPPRRLVLASQSVHRQQLLTDAGYLVEVCPSHVEEPQLTADDHLEASLIHLAQQKCRGALERGARGLILGADTVGVVQGQVFGKPIDREHARHMLQSISGTAHAVLTGWCLLRSTDELLLSGLERTMITMREWTADELEQYLDSGEWDGKCGAYGLQWPDDPFVTEIVGSSSNVIGIPLERIGQVFAEFSALVDE